MYQDPKDFRFKIWVDNIIIFQLENNLKSNLPFSTLSRCM